MPRKRHERTSTGLFDVPGRRHDIDDRDDRDDRADSGESVGVFGGPTHDSRLFGGPGLSSGLLDAPERTPGDMPGLFDRPGHAAGKRSGFLSAQSGDGSGQSVGLFDKPRRGGRT